LQHLYGIQSPGNGITLSDEGNSLSHNFVLRHDNINYIPLCTHSILHDIRRATNSPYKIFIHVPFQNRIHVEVFLLPAFVPGCLIIELQIYNNDEQYTLYVCAVVKNYLQVKGMDVLMFTHNFTRT